MLQGTDNSKKRSVLCSVGEFTSESGNDVISNNEKWSCSDGLVRLYSIHIPKYIFHVNSS